MHYRNAEPPLGKALSEDLVRAIIKADQVDPASISGLADQRKQHLEQHS
jgi:hypothetical protein